MSARREGRGAVLAQGGIVALVQRAELAQAARRASTEAERAPKRPPPKLFVGPACERCGQQKLRVVPLQPGALVWCFGCGLRAAVASALWLDVEAFAEDCIRLLRDIPRALRERYTDAEERGGPAAAVPAHVVKRCDGCGAHPDEGEDHGSWCRAAGAKR